jgi:hypothetical protein
VAPRGPRPGEVPAVDEPPEMPFARVAPSTPAGAREAEPPEPPTEQAPQPRREDGGDGEQLTLDDA